MNMVTLEALLKLEDTGSILTEGTVKSLSALLAKVDSAAHADIRVYGLVRGALDLAVRREQLKQLIAAARGE